MKTDAGWVNSNWQRAFWSEQGGDVRGAHPTIYYMLTDHLSGMYKMVRDDGTAVTTATYSTWGVVTFATGSDASLTAKNFTGQDRSENSGLIFYQSRWYDPCIMRWLTPDTVIPDPYNPLDFDRYQYVRSNPVNLNDPTGHFTCEDSMIDCDARRMTWLLTSENKRARISFKAKVIQANEKDSLQAFAQLVDYASTLYKPNDVDNFMLDMDCVINGYCVGNGNFIWIIGIGGLGRGGESWIGTEPFMGKGSWATLYYDYTDSQMYHFWFYVGLDYSNGPVVATEAVSIHDSPSSQWVTSKDMDVDQKGNSRQDYLLGLAGVQMGRLIWSGELKLYDIGNWIIINLGEPNGPH